MSDIATSSSSPSFSTSMTSPSSIPSIPTATSSTTPTSSITSTSSTSSSTTTTSSTSSSSSIIPPTTTTTTSSPSAHSTTTTSTTSPPSSSSISLPSTSSSSTISFTPRHLVSKSPTSTEASNASSRTFVVMTYNVLTDTAIPPGTYGYCDVTHRHMPQRHLVILDEIRHYRPSILCLQELDEEAYEKYFKSNLQDAGYDSAICAYRKLNDVSLGEGIFFLPHMFRCEASRRDVLSHTVQHVIEEDIALEAQEAVRQRLDYSNQALLAKLRHLGTNKVLHVVNAHILWADLKLVDVQTLQIALVSQCLEDFMSSDAGGGGARGGGAGGGGARGGGAGGGGAMYIYAGDLNTPPDNPGYSLLLEGRLSPHDLHTLQAYSFTLPNNKISSLIDEIPTKAFTSNLSYASAYRDAIGAEPKLTSMDHEWKICLDYIWFSPQTLEVSTVVAPPADEIFNSLPGLPSAKFPSDHIPLVASFTIPNS